MQKSGNNTLFLLVGLLIVILMGLIFIGSMQESAVEQLIEGAGPDSSAYVQENPSQIVEETAENQIVDKPEEPAKILEAETVKANTDSTSSNPAVPSVEKNEVNKVQDSGGEKIYFYTIRKGDTMYKIAAKFGNKPDDILALNGLTDMALQADKEIKVKIKGLHPVQEGEGLNAVAEKYSVPAKSIKIANGLPSDNLPSGTELIIPLK
ncbi:MAG TPA: LysM peptidoglycan-binding domain-containing protein [Catalimonadaceae bacterium]|jgi:LysM repeat protein|nr:LysM peptidoglycan-binding domain-containing protein [Catalimonadaceae bacterium]